MSPRVPLHYYYYYHHPATFRVRTQSDAAQRHQHISSRATKANFGLPKLNSDVCNETGSSFKVADGEARADARPSDWRLGIRRSAMTRSVCILCTHTHTQESPDSRWVAERAFIYYSCRAYFDECNFGRSRRRVPLSDV